MMAQSSYVFEATADNFDHEVLQRSLKTPILVDFWASWCQPCQMLMPVLTKVAEDSAGKFYLAKVNADEEPELARRYSVRSLPTAMLFLEGRAVDQFMGALPESAVRAFMEPYLPRPTDVVRERAAELRQLGDGEAAVKILRDARLQDPENMRVTLDLLDALVELDYLDEAEQLLSDLPISARQEAAFRSLEAQLDVRRRARGTSAASLDSLRDRVASTPEDLEARSQFGAQLILAGQPEAAMDQYLEIMRRDRDYNQGVGRKGLLDVFQLLGEKDPRVSSYRRKMATLLY